MFQDTIIHGNAIFKEHFGHMSLVSKDWHTGVIIADYNLYKSSLVQVDLPYITSNPLDLSRWRPRDYYFDALDFVVSGLDNARSIIKFVTLCKQLYSSPYGRVLAALGTLMMGKPKSMAYDTLMGLEASPAAITIGRAMRPGNMLGTANNTPASLPIPTDLLMFKLRIYSEPGMIAHGTSWFATRMTINNCRELRYPREDIVQFIETLKVRHPNVHSGMVDSCEYLSFMAAISPVLNNNALLEVMAIIKD